MGSCPIYYLDLKLQKQKKLRAEAEAEADAKLFITSRIGKCGRADEVLIQTVDSDQYFKTLHFPMSTALKVKPLSDFWI